MLIICGLSLIHIYNFLAGGSIQADGERIDTAELLKQNALTFHDRQIKANPDDVYKYTFKGRTVAVVTNGTAVLGLGNIGPEAGLPVDVYKRHG